MSLPTRLGSTIRDVVTADGKRWAFGILALALGGARVWYLISADQYPATNEVPPDAITYWLPDTHDAELAREQAALRILDEASR